MTFWADQHVPSVADAFPVAWRTTEGGGLVAEQEIHVATRGTASRRGVRVHVRRGKSDWSGQKYRG